MATLYHYTSTHHLQFIMAHGRLMTTESNLSPEQYTAPMCVWLTTDPDPKGKHGIGLNCAVNKEEVRFTLDVPDDLVHGWNAWAGENGIDAGWRRFLVESSGGKYVTDTWRLVFQSVPSSMWVAVENLATGENYDLTNAGYDLNEEYFDFAETAFPGVVTGLQAALADGVIPGVAEEDVRLLLAEQALYDRVITASDKMDVVAWLSRSNIPASILNSVYVGAPHLFRTGRLPDGDIAVICQSNVPQMNRAQRRAAKSRRKVA